MNFKSDLIQVPQTINNELMKNFIDRDSYLIKYKDIEGSYDKIANLFETYFQSGYAYNYFGKIESLKATVIPGDHSVPPLYRGSSVIKIEIVYSEHRSNENVVTAHFIPEKVGKDTFKDGNRSVWIHDYLDDLALYEKSVQ